MKSIIKLIVSRDSYLIINVEDFTKQNPYELAIQKWICLMEHKLQLKHVQSREEPNLDGKFSSKI